jgi:hypothetical protein
VGIPNEVVLIEKSRFRSSDKGKMIREWERIAKRKNIKIEDVKGVKVSRGIS